MRSTDRPGRASRDQRGERLGALRRRGVDDQEPQVAPVADGLARHRTSSPGTVAAPRTFVRRQHLAVGHLEHRVHRQQLPGQRLRAADPPAPLEVGQRVQRDEAAGLAPGAGR